MTFVWRVWNYIKLLFVKSPSIVAEQSPSPSETQKEEAEQESPSIPQYREPRAKWVKPKGTEKLTKTPRAPRESRTEPRLKPKTPRPELRPDDSPEKWGQYYFRDAILDQLSTYFIYLKRMKRGDRDAYNLHRNLGIQIMPQSAVQTFDDWRGKGELDQLSKWFCETRPAFGAVSYGIDKAGLDEESLKIIDASPEDAKAMKWAKLGDTHHRLVTITPGANEIVLPVSKQKERPGIIWVPKFMYFVKHNKSPEKVQSVNGGCVYVMTVYWDRVDGYSRGWHKRHKGGVPQEYAVWVDDAGNIKVLRRLIFEQIKMRSRRGSFKIPNKQWCIAADGELQWAFGRTDASPEDYLRRCFVEAALMYESAALGSMIRVEASKGKLTATFGVEVKRTSYFFKDRDVTLTTSGKRARIFHIVRPHVRITKKGELPIKMHFRGLRQFEWAGYKVRITVPGLDHFVIPEFNIGSMSKQERRAAARRGETIISNKEISEELVSYVKDGRGAWQKNRKEAPQSQN